MRLLILGYSSIVCRKVLPAAIKVFGKKSIVISSRRNIDLKAKGIACIQGYEVAIKQSKADIVYVSTVNSEHAYWVKKALEARLHVIVDKPAFLTLNDTRELLSYAEKQKCLLAEAVVYTYHLQMKQMTSLFREKNCEIQLVTAHFTMPELDENNFRYNKDLGGGAFWDLSPYAVSLVRYLFNEVPTSVRCYVNDFKEENGVDTSFSVAMSFRSGKSFLGHFAIGKEYCNQVQLISKHGRLTLNRIFTTPDDCENRVEFYYKNNFREITLPKSDSFVLFLDQIKTSILSNSWKGFANDLVYDAELIDRLRNNLD